MIIFGTDEAGYGPNLGPLVVSLTVWETETENLSFLFELFQNEQIRIGDSKKIYHGGGSLIPLEIGVLVPMRLLKKYVTPIAADEKKLANLLPKFESILQKRHVSLKEMRHRSVEPEEFNRLLDKFDSKGSLLSDITLRLISDQLKKEKSSSPVLILCDKHGGRNHYLDLLTKFFSGEFIQTVQESRESSVYRLTSAGRKLEFRFLAKGESQIPIALASMLSKYQRELAMIRFNEFWQSHISGLLLTAGYPEDAKRFKQDIAAIQANLGIADDSIWRKR